MSDYRFHLQITGPDGGAREFSVPLGITTIGRQAGNELVLEHPQVSRRHAQLTCTNQELEISDQGSSNGTYVNGEKLTPEAPHLLDGGDEIKIGGFLLKVRRAAVEEQPEPEKAEDQDVRAEVPAEQTPPRAEVEADLEEKALEPAPEPEEEQSELKPDARKEEKPEEEPAEEAPAAAPAEDLEVEEAEVLEEEQDKEPTPADGEIEKPEEKVHEKEPAPQAPVEAAPPEEPPVGPSELPGRPPDGDPSFYPPGLDLYSRRLIDYLPGIYHTDFISRYLAMIESILVPIEWNIENFDLFLDPGTSPEGFLPWLAQWFGAEFNASWTVEKRRAVLGEAHRIYARRGTRWALGRLLELYLGAPVEIDDTGEDLDPFTFVVRLPVRKRDVDDSLVEALIDANKPAHTTYSVNYRR